MLGNLKQIISVSGTCCEEIVGEDSIGRAGGWEGLRDVTASYLKEGNPGEGPVRANTQMLDVAGSAKSKWEPEVEDHTGN